MIVGVCGLGWTGSGAVKDLLSEYNEIYNLCGNGIDYEFSFVYKTDGILDLKYHLFDGSCREYSSIDAINRFLDTVREASGPGSKINKLTNNNYYKFSVNYINTISQVNWKYFILRDYTNRGILRQIEGRLRYKVQRWLDAHSKRYISVFPQKNCFLSIRPSNFDSASKAYIANIINSIIPKEKREKILLLDQPFAGDCPEKSFPYFDDPFAIIVDRDPRDLFLFMKKVCFSQGHLTDNVKDFVEFYKTIRENESNETNRILRLRFEDLIYQYDKTVNTIEHFLGIKNHLNKFKFFNPDISIKNTQLIKKYPEEINNIIFIEKELNRWLYPFNNL